MARVTVEDCLTKVENRFSLVLLAVRRARQLQQGTKALVTSENKPCVTALREIAAGNVKWDLSEREILQGNIPENKRHRERDRPHPPKRRR